MKPHHLLTFLFLSTFLIALANALSGLEILSPDFSNVYRP